VIVLAVGVLVKELKLKQVPLPAILVIVAVTLEPVLKAKPEGAVKINVPLEGKSRFAPSCITGPVSAVYDPPVVSAEMLALANVVTLALAKTDEVETRNRLNPVTLGIINFAKKRFRVI